MAASHSPTKLEFARSVIPYLMPARSGLEGRVFASKTATGRDHVVYTPPGYGTDQGKSYPVLYHLHGAGARWSWVKKDLQWIAAAHETAVAARAVEPMIIVGAYDPTHFSMWSDSVDGTNDQATAVLADLIPHVEATYSTRTDRQGRFIQGFSMGGFGAATLGLQNQDRFGAIIIWDGALHDWTTLSDSRPAIAANQFGDDGSAFDAWSPWATAERADLGATPVMIVSGLLVDFADRYERHLIALGADVSRATTDCLHDLRCLERSAGSQVFTFIGRVLASPSHPPFTDTRNEQKEVDQ